MWASSKKSRMISTLEVEAADPENPQSRVRNIKSVDGRVVVLCLTTWFFGYVLTQTSLFTPVIWYHNFGIEMTYETYIGPNFGLIPLGAAVGVIIAHFTMNKFNRRTYLVILNILNLIVTALLQINNTPTLFVFRLLQGIIAGVFMSFIPAYISELTPKELGSRYGVYPQISVVLGVLVSFTVGMIMTDAFDFENLPGNIPVEQVQVDPDQTEIYYRVMLGIALLPSLFQLFFMAIGYLPESPHSLIIKNKKEEARDVLALFYEEEYVNQILEEKEKAIFESKNVQLDSQVNWTSKGYYLGFQLAIFQVLTGIASYVTQAGHVITVALQEPIFGLYTPILITISQLIGTFISIPMLKYIEWKYLTILGGFSLAFWNALAGVFFYLYDDNNASSIQPYAMTLIMICIMAFMFTFGITVGSSVWPYISYMMPSSAVLVAQVINWLLAGISIIAFSFNVNATSNPWIIVWVYTGITFVLTILNLIFMVDIKGLSVRKAQMKLAED